MTDLQNDPEAQRYRTAFVGASDITIEDKLAQTRQLHEKLCAIWNVTDIYNVNISIFPNQEDYDALPIDETITGTHREVKVKYQTLTEGFASTTITYYRPS